MAAGTPPVVPPTDGLPSTAPPVAPPVPPPAPPPVPLDLSPVKFVLYRDKFDVIPVPINNTWGGFVEFIEMIEHSPCAIDGSGKPCIGKECKYKSFSSLPNNYMVWSPVIIEGQRDDRNVKYVTLLSLDLDHLKPEQLDDVKARLAPYEYVMHTTHNHRVNDLGIRPVLLLSRPVHANEFHRFFTSAVMFLAVPADPVCKNRSRYYYRPSHPKGAPYWTFRNRGVPLDVDAVLAWGTANMPPEPTSSAPREIVETGDWDLNSEHVVDAIDLMGRYFPPRRRNEFCLALAGILRTHGANEEDAKWIVREICVQGGSQDPDARAKTVDHTYGLSDGSFMTSVTRAAEILGESLNDPDEGERIAKEFGDHLTALAQEALLSSFAQAPTTDVGYGSVPSAASAFLSGGSAFGGGASAVPPVPPPVASPVPQAPVDLGQVKKAIQSLAARRGRSTDRDDKIVAVLLRRLLSGEQLAGFDDDVETDKISLSDAIDKVAGSLGFALDAGYTADDVGEVVKFSLLACGRHADGDWLSTFKKKYKLSHDRRKLGELQRDADQRTVRARAAAQAGVGVQDEKWRDRLQKKADGGVASTPQNLALIFDNDPVLKSCARWNEYAKRMELVGGSYGLDSERAFAIEVRRHLSECHELHVSRQEVEDQLVRIAYRNSYDPLAEHLRSLAWDGVERIDTWLMRYFGAPDTPHMRRISRRWFLGAIARAFEPGAKFDNVLVFHGLQGRKKTSAFEALGGKFYTSSEINLHDKDSKMIAGVSWLCELAELESMRRTETTAQKAFLSQREDFYRPPYGAQMKTSKRRVVFLGSTNEPEFLSDTTGNRRWWVVHVYFVLFAELLADRDQLWAEAVHAYMQHEWCPDCLASTDTVFGQKPRCQEHRWWLSPVEEEEAKLAVEEYEEERPSAVWEEKILAWWSAQSQRPASLTVAFVATEIGELSVERASSRSVQTQIGMALRELGFRRNPSQRHWVPSDILKNMPAGRANALGVRLFPIPGGKK